jgi:ribonucleotide reductase alpha subunit
MNEGDNLGKLSNCTLNNITINKVGIGVANKHAIWIASNANGGFILNNSKITDIQNDSKSFTITK